MLLTERRKRMVAALFAIAMLLAGWLVLRNAYRRNYIERRLVAAIDRQCEEEGECDIDLAEVFAELDWDTVSVFVAGNTAQILDLGVYSEISDGIVFSKAGSPVKKHLSCYGFPEDVPPLISYYLDDAVPNSTHYITLPREHAIVHAQKYRFRDGSYKYNVIAKPLP